MRGFASIGLSRPKSAENVGSVLRAAHVFGASAVCIEGERCRVHSATNTTAAEKHVPVLRGDDLFALCPYGAVPIAIDIVDGATPLHEFEHPASAFYVFGPEDGTLGVRHLSRCKYRVFIPTAFCMNLAATVNVVLYDRACKRGFPGLQRRAA